MALTLFGMSVPRSRYTRQPMADVATGEPWSAFIHLDQDKRGGHIDHRPLTGSDADREARARSEARDLGGKYVLVVKRDGTRIHIARTRYTV